MADTSPDKGQLKPPHVPSAQHLVRLFDHSPLIVREKFESVRRFPPRYNYVRSRKWSEDVLKFGVGMADLERDAQSIADEKNRALNLQAVEAVIAYSKEFWPHGSKFLAFDKIYYPLGRDMLAPVNPLCFRYYKGEWTVVWISFWKDFPADFDSNAFGAILNRSVFKDPDLRNAKLEFVDLSRPDHRSPRAVRVVARREMGDLTDAELKAYTDVFAAVYREAFKAHMEAEKKAGKSKGRSGQIILDHPSLFR